MDRIGRLVPANYPIMLDVSNRRIVVIGGGAVAARKVASLVAAGATRIRVVSPELKAKFPETAEIQIGSYHCDVVKDADLVFTATDVTAVNDAVVRDCRALGIWVNRADASDDLSGDFSTPAKFQTGAITVTVSAGSAALTTMVRDQLQERFDPAWAVMADAMKELRPMIKITNDAGDRPDLFRALATPEAITILRDKGIDGLKEWITQLNTGKTKPV
jgi:siroheme synthase-like protein